MGFLKSARELIKTFVENNETDIPANLTDKEIKSIITNPTLIKTLKEIESSKLAYAVAEPVNISSGRDNLRRTYGVQVQNSKRKGQTNSGNKRSLDEMKDILSKGKDQERA